MKEGLIYVSDRLGQLRYSDKDEKIRWLQPLSSYKALVDIKRGQAVSVATTSEINSVLKDEQLEAYNENPSPYIVPTNTSIHNRCIGLALETVKSGDDVHILSSGQFEYITNNANEYSPKFTAEHISKKVYVSNVPGELTTDSEVAYEQYKNIIQIGHIIDAPQVEKEKQNTIVLEIQIQGDDRGILESTQFEAVLGENVCINKDEPLTVFAFGQEEASKFKLKLCTRTTTLSEEQLKTSFIVIKKLSGEYSLIKFSENEISTDDDTDLGTLKLLKSRYEPEIKTVIENIDFTNSKNSIYTIIKALNDAIKEMGSDLEFIELESSTDGDFSSATLELNQDGGYYDIYYSNSLKDFLRDTTVLQNGSYDNKNTAILADIRIDARRNVFGVLVNSFDNNTILEKGSRILLMRQGELVVNTERDLPAIGKKFVLGESGAVVSADDALRTADSSNTIGYLKKVHNLSDDAKHYHFVIDIGENIPKVEYSTYPVGYLKPYYGSLEVGEETPDFGYLLTGKQYPKKGYEEIYERLLGWYDENDIEAPDNGDYFIIPLIKDTNDRPMQIKYVTDGIFERLPKVPYLRDFGNISETEGHACGINDLDITALLSINTTFSEVDTLPLENLDIHLYIDPDYTEGEHNWKEVYPGFYKYNNVDTYGFEWKLEKAPATEKDIYGKYILSADIGDSRGIYYTSSNNVAPISCDKVPYKLYVAVKQKNIEHFDLRNLMSNYISSTVYNNDGEIDDVYAVTGEAVINAIKNNKWFKYLKNETEDSVIDFGGTKKLNTDVNIQTNEVIRLNCEVETTSKNSVLIGETTEEIEGKITKYTTLEIKDGKAFLKKLNTNLFLLDENNDFVNDGEEVATIDDVLDHALMSIDDKINIKDTIKNNATNNQGRIHGMKFGEGGNVDASTLCSFGLGIAFGQNMIKTSDAKIPIIYKEASGVHTPLQGYLDYYTDLTNDTSSKLFSLYPSYEITNEVLDLKFTKDDVPVNKISFGGAKIVAETELPSLSRYKTIYKENKLDRAGQFTTELNKDSKPSADDNISFDFAYILQAAYELPMAYWKYRDSSEYNIGPIIERLQDTINYFENKENDITYTVDGDKDPYIYTTEQKSGIAKSLKDIIAESGKSVRADDMVGFLLAAAGETQKRLAKLERSTYGRDVMEKEKINFENLDGVTPDHTYYGLNRLVRAICLELFGKADPNELTADEATLTSLSRMDAIERQIRGSRNTPDKDNGSITDNSINDFDAADPDNDDVRYSISSSYPYKEDITKPENVENIKNEDITSTESPTAIITKETIFGDTPADDTDSFNGVVDAIYRITQKVDVLTEAINGTNDILQPHTTLNKIKRNIETLIREVYFDGRNGEEAYKDILGKGEIFDERNEKSSRVDEITKDLYTHRLEYENCGDDEDLTSSEKLDKYNYPNAFYNSNTKKFDIVSPENIDEYEDNLSIIDIILKAIGNQILLKHYSDQDGSTKKLRFNKDISQRLYDIEQCLDKVVLKLKDSKNFESFESTNDSTTILNLDDFNDALSKLLGYTPKENSTENDKFISSSGVKPGAEDNSDKFSAEYALRTKSNIVAGLENILYRVQNEEKDNLRIKEVLGKELMKGVFVKTTEAGNGEQDVQTIAPIVDPKNFNLSDDIKDLLATIYGEPRDPDSESQPNAGNNTTYKHRTIARGTNGSFLNGGNIIEKIVNELYYIPKPFDSDFIPLENENLSQNVIYVNHNANVDNTFFNGSLIDGNNRENNFEESGRKSRLDILESDVKALRNFIGLTKILEKATDTKAKTIAVSGDFLFNKNTDSDDYGIFGSGYTVSGNEEALTSSFIESFFNLMKRVDEITQGVKNIVTTDTFNSAINNINTELKEKLVKEDLKTIEDDVTALQTTNKKLTSDLTNKFNISNIIKSDDEAASNDDTVYSSSKVDNLLLTKAKKDEVDALTKNIAGLGLKIDEVDGKYSDLPEKVNKLQDEIELWKDGETNLAVYNISGNTATISLDNFKKFRFLLPDNPIAYEYYNVNYKTQSFCNAQHINGNTYHIKIDMKASSTYIYVTDLEIKEADNSIKKYEPFIYTLSVSNPEVPTDSTGE